MEARAQAAEARLAHERGLEALDTAIHAVELYMKAADEASNKAEATRLRRKLHSLITYGEKLKKSIDPKLLAEHQILRDGSRLYGTNFPPWRAEPQGDEFSLDPSGQLFTDDTPFALSETQSRTFSGWMRPRDIFRVSELDPELDDEAAMDDALMATARDIDLVQDVTTDCSVVAGLSAAIEILTGKQSILSSIIYPFDHANCRPRYSASGRYILKLNFNGCYRRIVIDDRLPASSDDGNFFVVDRSNERLLWPALLEKAYLKVRGGYDFPGSNSGTDLWVITGWIPEQIFLQRDELDINQLWQRIKKAHDFHHLVITLGTGCISEEEERATGFVGEHDYSVQDLDEREGVRRLLVKNPWCGGPYWGPDRDAPSEGEVSPSPHRDFAGLSLNDNCKANGCLWMSLEDVAQHFESMYLNWNPKLFSYRHDRHFKWKMPSRLLSSTLLQNPQFSIMSPTGGLVWILISRHFVDEELDILRNKTANLAATSRQLGFTSILVFDSKGARVQIPDGETYRGPYVDSPQTLARLDTTAGKRYTVVLDQHEFPLSQYTFTMSTFSNSQVEVQDATEPMPHAKDVRGAWSRRNAGGSAACGAFFSNPQYSITVPKATPLSLLLATDSRDIYVHVDLVWAHGKRVNTLRVRDLVASSGEYRRGCVVAHVPLVDAGTYTIVCSTFEADQMADFFLRVASAVSLTVEPIPTEVAGKIRQVLSPLSLSEKMDRARAPLSVNWLTRASVSARKGNTESSVGDGFRSPSSMLLRLSVVMGRGPEQITIAVSGQGEFQEPLVALQTPEFDMEPEKIRAHGMWLVVEGLGLNSGLQVLEGVLYSDSPVQVGAWAAV